SRYVMALNSQPCCYVKTVTTVNCSLVSSSASKGRAVPLHTLQNQLCATLKRLECAEQNACLSQFGSLRVQLHSKVAIPFPCGSARGVRHISGQKDPSACR